MIRPMKDSGVGWIEEIPSNWSTKRLRFMFSFGKGLSIKKEDLTDEGVPVISYGQIHSKKNPGTRVVDELIRFVPEVYLKTNPSCLCSKGDFIFADTSEDLGGCGNAVLIDKEYPIFAGYHAITARPIIDCDSRFFAYMFLTDGWRDQFRKMLIDVKVYSVNQTRLKNTTAIIPPYDEQQSIADYLDEKCSQIDQAIERCNSIADRLADYKKTLIFHCATKGLNPDVEMKASGIEWIGDIPKNWETRRLKYLFDIKKDIAGEEGHTVLSITQRGIVPKDLESNQGQVAESYANYQLVEPGDFAMNHMDLLTGWVDISKYPGVTSPDYRVFKIQNPNLSFDRYMLYLLQTCYSKKIFYGLGAGVSGLGRWRLQAPVFKNFVFPVPPIEEQKAIAGHLDVKCAQIDQAIEKQRAVAERLADYRKSIIYQAVTGKIDCRKEA